MRHSLLILVLGLVFNWSNAQSASPWSAADASELNFAADLEGVTTATNYRLVRLDQTAVLPTLVYSQKNVKTIELPLPDGSDIAVQITPTSVLAPGLAARYPSIKTYRVLPQGKEILGGRVDWTSQGLHASIQTNHGHYYIDPYAVGTTDFYVSYDVRDNIDTEEASGFQCGVTSHTGLDIDVAYPPAEHYEHADFNKDLLGASIVQRKYRLAMACTGEFSRFHAGTGNEPTVEISLGAIATIINRVNEITGRDLAVQFEIIENNDRIIYLDNTTDPYDDFDTNAMLSQNPSNLTSELGPSAFDIGHVIGRGPAQSGQGIASLESVCTGRKGAGVSTRRTPQGDPFVVNILCHEMGHQMGGTHAQSSCQNVQPETAIEPGGGTTIMGYAGICPTGNNLQQNADPYFNTVSLQQIFDYMREANGSACGTTTDEGNTIPDVTDDYEDDFYIPVMTPFQLTAMATDMEDDNLTYCWEQVNIDPNQYVPGSPQGDIPVFRSLPPTSSPTRVFPRLSRIVNNTSQVDEVLVNYSRNMDFRCTVRDNHPTSGGASWTSVSFDVTDSAGPFLVTSPNTDEVVWEVGEFLEVNWDVANTDNSVVNCQRVNITLSTDGGFTYPITLLENTPNDGSAFITVPDAVGDQVRMRVDAADNIFFDISNQDFEIVPATAPRYALNYGPQTQQVCAPGEEASVSFSSTAINGFSETLIFDITSELPDGVVSNINATTLTPGEDLALTLNFDNSIFGGALDVEVRTIAGMDTTYRTFDIFVVSTDFSDFALTSPAQGTSGIVLSTEYAWTADADANSYNFELATSPLFGDDVVLSTTGLTGTNFTPEEFQLESNQLYFWRMQPINACGNGDWSVPSVFQTELVTCTGAASIDVPKTIPGTGPPPTIISELNISESGQISEVSVSNVNIAYNPTQNFQVILRSPNMTEVLLYDKNCFFNDRIFLGFDNDSPDPISCPATDGSVYQPVGDLNDFVGQGTEGIWELEVKVVESGGGAPGSIDSWGLEFCAGITPPQMALINNNPLEVPPGQTNPLQEPLLKVGYQDSSVDPVNFIYTLVSLPENGVLKDFFGSDLTVGSTFTQASIDALNIRYTHNDSPTTSDAFYFIAEDGNGAFWPVERFDIVIDDQAVVNTEEIDRALNALQLFPNPAQDQVSLRLGEAVDADLPVHVFSVDGRQLLSTVLAKGTTQQTLDVAQWPAGIYFVRVADQSLRLLVE